MLKNSLFNKLIILFFAVPALACALTGGEEPTATPSPAPTSTVEVAVAATEPAPTPSLEASPTIDVSADFVSYTSEETGITVEYPADWVIQDFFVLVLATDETLFDAPGAIQEGAGVVFTSSPLDEFESTDPITILSTAVEEFNLSEDAEIVEGPTAVTINGQPGATARIEGTADETETGLVGQAVVVINGDWVGVGLGMTTEVDQDQYIPIINAILNTIEVSEPVEEPEINSSELPTIDGSTPIFVGDTMEGTFDEEGNLDFIFEGEAGSTVTFSVEPSNEELDLVLEIFDIDGNSLVLQDEGFSDEGESIIFTPESTGEYFVRVKDFFNSPGGFTITVVEGGVEGNIDPNASPLAPRVLIEGALAGEANQYEFAASAGQTTTIMLIPLDDWDPTLTILNSDGTVAVNRVDNGFPGDSEVITFIPEEDGNYIVLVDGFSNAEGSYNLFLLDPEVAYSTEGSVETDEVQDIRVCVPANASLAIVVLPAEGFDVVINVKDGNGANVIEEVDGTPSGDPEAVFVNESINPDAAYPLIVSISGWAGQEGEFSVFITSTSEEEVAIDGC